MNTEQKRKKDWTDLDYYEHYKRTRRIGFSSFRFKPLKSSDYNQLKNDLKAHKEHYYKIYNIATIEDRKRIKNDFIDNLYKLLESQDKNERNIKDLISSVIDEIKLANNLNKHPKYDPNLFNNKGYELFKYLFDNFYTFRKRELTNIWFFLKECDPPSKYVLYATKDKYKAFILKNYGIKIKNFDKSQYNYINKVKPKLKEHLIDFEDSLK